MRTPIRKAAISLLFVLAIALLGLVACAQPVEPDPTAEPPDPTEVAVEPTEPVAEPTEVVAEPTEEPVAEPSVMRVGNTHDVVFLDAQRVQAGYDLPHSDLLYSRLTMYDDTMMFPRPDVAESWTVSDDGLTYVFKLREDVKFHTGRGLTAEDVVYSWERALETIGDAGRALGEMGAVESYEATDTYEFTVTLSRLDPVFLTTMGHWGLALVDRETIDQIDTQPIGTGPYRFVEHVPDDRLVLEKFQEYYDQAALANWPDRIVLIPFVEERTRVAALQAGEIDLIVTVAYEYLDEIKEAPGLQLIEQVGGTCSYMTVAFNLREGPTADVRVRKAIQHAIDKEAIHRAVYLGLGQVDCNLIPADHWAHEPLDCPPRDIEMARQLLADAGYPDGLTLSYIPQANELTQKMAEVIQQSLAEAGIDIDITVVERSTWLDQVWFGHDFEITDAWYTREPDPDGLMQSVLRKGLGNNVMGYDNPEIEDLFDAGKATLDPDERRAIYTQIVEIVVFDDVPLINIQSMPRFAAANDKIQNAHVSPKGYFHFKDFTFVANP